jgi:anhydro-N-acetylmuramic acid kinase
MKLVPKVAIGLMSGTSCDGVDAALIETDGEKVFSRGPSCFVPYELSEQKKIKNIMKEVAQTSSKAEQLAQAALVEELVRERHVQAIEKILKEGSKAASDIDIVGFHGQTLFHDPDHGFTLQVGDGERLAKQVGIPVVYDFRSEDMKSGGQGAPLVPIYHYTLVKELISQNKLSLPVAVVNIGGVANVTYIGFGEEGGNCDQPDMLAFDTGPGNALINDWVEAHTGELMDKDGGYAACGEVNQTHIMTFLENSYFQQTPPKSLDRDQFETLKVGELSLDDGAATLTEMTVKSIALSQKFMKDLPKSWIVVGGGAKNDTLMKSLGSELGQPIVLAEDIGWQADQIEAEAFGFLAVRHLVELPFSFPSTTGVSKALCGGLLASL